VIHGPANFFKRAAVLSAKNTEYNATEKDESLVVNAVAVLTVFWHGTNKL
jgi:hypothetical protein